MTNRPESGASANCDRLIETTELDGYAVVRLNRPRARNSLVWESWTQLDAALDGLESRPQVRCVILTGTGGFFSAGGDLKVPPAYGSGPLSAAARLELAHRVLLRIRSFRYPVIAAVEGGAVGLGWSLVLACDLIIAAKEAFFSAPFVARGVVPDGGAAWFLTERLGRQRAGGLLLTDARLTAHDAAQLGLVNKVCESGEAEATAASWAEEMAAADPGALEMTKRLLARCESTSLEEYFPLELATATIAQLARKSG